MSGTMPAKCSSCVTSGMQWRHSILLSQLWMREDVFHSAIPKPLQNYFKRQDFFVPKRVQLISLLISKTSMITGLHSWEVRDRRPDMSCRWMKSIAVAYESASITDYPSPWTDRFP